MASTKPTIVLVPGGWHIPETYSKFTNSLRSAGYEVHIPRLPSMNGARPPNTDLTTDTVLVHDYVESLVEAGRQVVAIMHSYGGQVGTNALYGLGMNWDAQHQESPRGGVTHLIYMAAYALPESGSLIAKVREFGHQHLMPLAFEYADDGTFVSRDPKTLLVGPGVEDAEADAYVASFVRWNAKCMDQEATQCAWREIPTSYIYTNQDMTVPLEYQKSMVDRLKAEGRDVQTFELDTGHCPNLTKTRELVEIIEEIVSGHSG
ncbi:MAG: hypothetical protein Q9168_006838 [Polycauliona sp. 1 TL-2023]